MKNYIYIAVAAVAFWFFFFRKKAQTPTVIQQTTGKGPSTTNPPNTKWFPGWDGFTQQSLQNQTKTVTGTFNGLKALANNFGWNDGGSNDGVSISGSKRGGTQSSGSGAGVPVDNSDVDSFLGSSVSPSDYNGFFQLADFGN